MAKGGKRCKGVSTELDYEAGDADFMEEPELQTSRSKNGRSARALRLVLDSIDERNNFQLFPYTK
jgi:hypothetical protein